MAYKFNGSDIVTPFTIASNQPMHETTTVSLKTQRASQGAQRWEFSFTTINTADTVGDMLAGMVDNLDTVESMIVPQAVTSTIVGVQPKAPALAVGATSFTTTNSIDTTGAWQKGEFFNFSGHDKLYMVTSTGETDAPVSFFPPLVAAVSDGATIQTWDFATIKYLRTIDTATGITFSDGVLSSPGTITIIEAL
jgi:hypothetical protein